MFAKQKASVEDPSVNNKRFDSLNEQTEEEPVQEDPSFYNANDDEDDYDDSWDHLYDESEFDNMNIKRRRNNKKNNDYT